MRKIIFAFAFLIIFVTSIVTAENYNKEEASGAGNIFSAQEDVNSPESISEKEGVTAQNNIAERKRLALEKSPSFEPQFSVSEIFGDLGESLSCDELFRLSLLLSECPLDSNSAQSALKKFEKIKNEISSKKFMALDEETRGKEILKLLYRDTLQKYSYTQTKTNVAFELGTYNCVSSAVIYMAAAKFAGLNVKGQKTPDHAFCTLYIYDKESGNTRKIDVETTNPYGFNPGSKESLENEGQIKKYYVVPKKNYANRLEVSDKIFVALIAGNLCSYYIKSKEYFNAIPLGVSRYNLVCNENSKVVSEVRKDLDVLVCNYVNLLVKNAETCSEGLYYLASYYDLYGGTDYLQKNFDQICSNLMVYCNKEKNYPLAKQGYGDFKDYASEKQKTSAKEINADTQVRSVVEGKNNDEKILILNELLKSPDFKEASQQKKAKAELERAWVSILNGYINAKNYEEGYSECKKAMEQLPDSQTIKKMSNNFYNNIIAVFHNAFAKEANKKNYEEAFRILQEGLERFPGDKTLEKDKQLLLKWL